MAQATLTHGLLKQCLGPRSAPSLQCSKFLDVAPVLPESCHDQEGTNTQKERPFIKLNDNSGNQRAVLRRMSFNAKSPEAPKANHVLDETRAPKMDLTLEESRVTIDPVELVS
ncbi:hypothetical protein ACLOJK_014510 [Asimina triloba]